MRLVDWQKKSNQHVTAVSFISTLSSGELSRPSALFFAPKAEATKSCRKVSAVVSSHTHYVLRAIFQAMNRLDRRSCSLGLCSIALGSGYFWDLRIGFFYLPDPHPSTSLLFLSPYCPSPIGLEAALIPIPYPDVDAESIHSSTPRRDESAPPGEPGR